MIKVLDLFAGKGSFPKALKEIGKEVEIVGYSEILDHAKKAYKAIHNVSEDVYLGDVREVKNMKLPEFDILFSGSPCQDFTNEGRQKGGNRNTNTRSSLLWEQVEIAAINKPKYVIWENVEGLTHKKNENILPEYIQEMDKIGYNTYYEMLNSYNFNSVQKRKRYFTVSIRKDIDNNNFNFPEKIQNNSKLINILEDYNEKYAVPEKILKELVLEKLDKNKYKIKNATKQGYLIAEEGDGIDFSFPTSKTRRGRVQKYSCQTLKTQVAIGTIQDDKFRYLTPLEYWRAQNFSDESFHKAKNAGLNEKELYSLAGNSINLNVLKALLAELLKEEK